MAVFSYSHNIYRRLPGFNSSSPPSPAAYLSEFVGKTKQNTLECFAKAEMHSGATGSYPAVIWKFLMSL